MFEYFLGYSMGHRAAHASRSAAVVDNRNHSNRIEDLNDRVDKLLMVVRAMWSLMEEQGLTAEQLASKIAELDSADGEVDGQVRGEVAHCAGCDSKVAPGLRACQLCGTEVRPGNVHPLSTV